MESKHYEKENITIVWKPNVCIHSGVCVRELPQVYKPKEKPWIQQEHASEAELIAQIDKCPSGALSYLRKNAAETNVKNSAAVIEVTKNGPVIITGDVTVKVAGREEKAPNGRVALCRCGASSRKPYCDGSHKGNGFEAE